MCLHSPYVLGLERLSAVPSGAVSLRVLDAWYEDACARIDAGGAGKPLRITHGGDPRDPHGELCAGERSPGVTAGVR